MLRNLSLTVFALLLTTGSPAAAEEILLKDGSKIVGHMNALQADTIEVDTAYGKMQVKRADIVTINFPENSPSANSAPQPQPVKEVAPPVDESLLGTQYLNKTNKFSLVVPVDWGIDKLLPRTPPMVTVLRSHDNMRFLTVTQEEFNGSMESYRGLLELTYRKMFAGYEEISESQARIDGKAAMLISFRGISAKANNLPVQFLVGMFATGPNTYTRVVTWCAEPLFHEAQPMFEKIINSYHGDAALAAAQSRKQ